MISIAIDGPSGAGKSTVAKATAEKFGYIYIDTGAMYRTVGLFALRNKINIDDAKEDIYPYLDKIDIDIKYKDGVQLMFLNGEDVTEQIRTPEVSQAASKVGAIKCVRQKLVSIQREMSKKSDVIMDGRDIGTNVLPNADIKIYMTALAEKRAERRYKELSEKGIKTSYDEVLRDIIKRDEYDSNRAESPLRVADDAIVFDSTNYDLSQSVKKISEIISERLKNDKNS